MDQILSLLSETVPKARTLEELTRPLLTLLGQVTGMESTYLTTIDAEEGVQRIECGFHGHLATHSMSIWPPIPR